MKPDSLLECELDGRKLRVSSLSFSYSLDHSLGSFEAVLGVREFDYVKTRAGSVMHIKGQGFERNCLLETISHEPQKELSIGGRDKVSIMLDSTARPESFAGGITLLSLGQKVCSEYGFSFDGPDKKIGPIAVNKGESSLAFLERASNPLILTSSNGSDIRVLKRAEEIEISKGFKLTGLEYRRNISDVFETYELADGSHSWMKGWEKPIKRKVKGSGVEGKKKIFFAQSTNLGEQARRREEESESIKISVDRVMKIVPGSLLNIDTMGIKGTFKAKSISYEISPSEASTSIEGVKV